MLASSEPNVQAACACTGFSRARLLRGAAARAAEAGTGLPAIEPGMPLPAGTGLSRRGFVLRSAGLALSVYGANALGLGSFEEGIAQAASGPSNAVLVSIFMEGGADSLSLLAPVGDARYATLRPTLALAPDQGTPFSEDPRLHWHPSAGGLATLHGEGKVSVFPAIGYTSPNQSHFTSRHFWEVGELNVGGRFGWMGRYLDRAGVPDNPLQGLSLDYDLAPSLAARNVPVAAVASPTNYTLDGRGVWGPVEDSMRTAYGAIGALPTSDTQLGAARRAGTFTDQLRQSLAPFSSFTSPVPYPSGTFAQRLAALAAMLGAGLPLKCVALSAPGGYDTHSNQASTLPGNLAATSNALLAFQRDLEARGLAGRVLTHVWSEFGRRPQENGSGTDHGAAGASLVIGTRAKGTMVGEFPGLATLDPQSNLRATSDFRALYCSLIGQWLGDDPAAVIPGASSFTAPDIVK